MYEKSHKKEVVAKEKLKIIQKTHNSVSLRVGVGGGLLWGRPLIAENGPAVGLGSLTVPNTQYSQPVVAHLLLCRQHEVVPLPCSSTSTNSIDLEPISLTPNSPRKLAHKTGNQYSCLSMLST